MLGLTTWQIVVLLSRGPHCDRYTWFGYEGGMEWRKSAVEGHTSSDTEKGKGTNQVGAEEASREAPKDEKDESMSPDMPPKV